MNRNQRRATSHLKKTDSEARVKDQNFKYEVKTVEDVFTPCRMSKKETKDKTMANRCCYVTPSQKEFGQFTDEYETILLEQYGFSPIVPDNISPLQDLQKVLCGSSNRVDSGSQYIKPLASFIEASDGVHWRSVDNADDIDSFILGKDEGTLTTQGPNYRSIVISELPRVKIIVEKFSRYKQNNVELRKLDEKVVCVEYDVFDQNYGVEEPVQIMRAFFSIKPVYDKKEDIPPVSLKELPPTVQNKFDIVFADLQKLSEKEVEMIDYKIAENRPYLDDLRKLLRRKQVSKKNKNSLNTQTLYELATMEYLNFERDNSNMLSKDELQEVKDFILTKCKSSVHGISRRTVKCESELNSERKVELNAISKSIMAELMRQEDKDIY